MKLIENLPFETDNGIAPRGRRETVAIDDVDLERADRILASQNVMGNGRIDGIQDIVYVTPDTLDKAQSRRVGEEVARLTGSVKKKKIEKTLDKHLD